MIPKFKAPYACRIKWGGGDIFFKTRTMLVIWSIVATSYEQYISVLMNEISIKELYSIQTLVEVDHWVQLLTDLGSSSSILSLASMFVMYMVAPFNEPSCTTNWMVLLFSLLTSPANGATIWIMNDGHKSQKCQKTNPELCWLCDPLLQLGMRKLTKWSR